MPQSSFEGAVQSRERHTALPGRAVSQRSVAHYVGGMAVEMLHLQHVMTG